MSQISFEVSLSPQQALQLVMDNENADLVYDEWHDLGDGKQIGTLVFEKYYFRTKNRAALVVISDNLSGTTAVRSVATGSSEGMLLSFDWGAADSFVRSVENILEAYILEDSTS